MATRAAGMTPVGPIIALFAPVLLGTCQKNVRSKFAQIRKLGELAPIDPQVGDTTKSMAGVEEACTYDFDCADSLVCYPGSVSWTGHDESVCLHVGFYVDPFTGSPNATTYYLATLCIVQIIVGIGLFALGVWDAGRTAYAFGRKTRLNAATATILYATCATLFHVLWQLCTLGTALSQEDFNHRASDAVDAEKLGRFSIEQRSAVFVCIFCMVLAALQVSVVWVEIAQRARRMTVVTANRVVYYRRAVAVFALVFAASMLPVAGLGIWGLSVPVAAPFILVIGTVFAVGRTRMVRLLNDHLSASASAKVDAPTTLDSPSTKTSAVRAFRKPFTASRSTATSQTDSREHRTRRAMLVIKRTSLHVILGLFMVLVAGLLYFVLDFKGVLTAAGGRAFMTPNFSGLMACQMLINLALLYILFVIQAYSHRNSSKLAERELRSKMGLATSRESSAGSREGGSLTYSNMQVSSFHVGGATGPDSLSP